MLPQCLNRMVFLDTFLFNGDWIVKLRLKYLYNYVDYFYVVESYYTFNGKRKEKLYSETCREWFAPYMDKVRFVSIDTLSSPRAWEEEKFQRNYILQVVQRDFAGQMYHLAVCDVDEIYNTDVLGPKGDLMHGTILFPWMSLYYHCFTHKVEYEPWVMAFIIHSTQILPQTNLDQIRVFKKCDGQETRVKGIPNAGWHFSFFMSAEDIQRKIQSFSHTELDTPRNTSLENIRESLREGHDIFGRNLQIKIIPLHSQVHSYPPWFAEFHRELLESQQIV